MNINFNDKLTVITGGASGIGEATAALMRSSGAKVVILDRKVPEQGDDRDGKPVAIHCDVSREDEVKNAFGNIYRQYGRINVLVNSAGIQTYGSVTETTEETWDLTMNVNVKGAFLCAKHAIPHMLECASPVVVNVASVKSFHCQRNEAAYVSSKAAILGLTRSIAADYSPRLRCVAVCPGAVNTPMLTKEFEKIPDKEKAIEETKNIHLLKRIATPEEVAQFIVFLASEQASFTTGQAYRVDGGVGICLEGI